MENIKTNCPMAEALASRLQLRGIKIVSTFTPPEWKPIEPDLNKEAKWYEEFNEEK